MSSVRATQSGPAACYGNAMSRGLATRRVARIAVTFGFACAPAACNALLDVPDAILRAADAGVESSATQSDSGQVDGGNDRDALEAQPLDAAEAGDALTGCCTGPGCPDLDTDPQNCGVCGHSCQGGSCDAGRCDPVVLAGSPTEYRRLKSLYGLVVLGDRLVGTDWYQPMTLVYTTPLDASLPTGTPLYPSLLADGGIPAADGASDQLATDGQRAFFGIYRDDNGWDAGIYSLELDGAVSKVASTAYLNSITTDDVHLYWADGQNDLWMANKDGTSPQSIPIPSSFRTQIVATGGYVFFTSENVLYRASPLSLGSTTVVSGTTTVSNFTADGSSLYWVDLNLQHVYRAPLDGSSAAVDMTPPGLSLTRSWVYVLVDDSFVYVFDHDIGSGPLGGSIFRIPKTVPATSFETMLTSNDGFGAATQDTTALYYTTYGSDVPDSGGPYSAVWKLAK